MSTAAEDNTAMRIAQMSAMDNLFFALKVYPVLLIATALVMGFLVYVLIGQRTTAFRDGYSAAISDFSEAGIELVSTTPVQQCVEPPQ